MAIGLQGVLYSYLKMNKIEAMMKDVVHPARNVTVADLQSWLGPVGFLPPECSEDDDSEDYKVDMTDRVLHCSSH